ncbi:MAG: nucleotide exchange factor GrpE [Nitrospinaceae bacterium]|nr:nucleotide exchange factor GrpE [Nitrospinaceae bacterium]NIR53799.1 nucleotide exchange factor GrpE [Nitrospinaceae bacterium]NIS84209.1 nucleotide exchange factor GrpE [Nitrospinaceae bacterium]NIT81015.1 nucleotide exchange factor GrpE [Nitrospinaceae bacterium]NIU43305.1 nucleotide exchange factor GrpE [Nitrospinaceae bacterium]
MGKKKKIPVEKEKTADASSEPEAEAPAESKPEAKAEAAEEGPSELEKLQQEVTGLKDEMLRMRAETDNVRKRLQKDKQESIQFANERLIKALIPIFENLDRALAAPDTNAESLKQGVKMISDQILALLKKENVEPICAKGEPFDPSVHECLSQIESDDHDENTVIEEYSKGYRMNGRVLLPAKVVTSRKPAAKKAEESADNASPEAETPA